MPSASTTVCQQCTLQPAKYTCPYCSTRTCSLSCTKAHPCSYPSQPSSSSAPSLSSTPSDVKITKDISSFIPLSKYSEANMLQDYLFLSSLSRTTAENGRKIVASNLLPPSTTGVTGGQQRQSNAQRQREQLVKQLHYRRYKVMVLPEGMARRKANGSSWNGKSKRFDLTVEIKVPGKQEGGWCVHKQQPEQSVMEVVLGEMERRSLPNGKERSKLKEGRKRPCWMVSIPILESAGLPVPTEAKTVEKEGEGGKLVVLHAWPGKEWAVVVPAYSARLTNESTTRYLDWWVRKRKWEEAHPELAALQREEQEQGEGEGRYPRPRFGQATESERGEQQRSREWGRKEDAQSQAEEMVSAPEPEPELASGGGGGIVSSSLLSLLSQRLGRSAPAPAAPLETAPPEPQSPPKEEGVKEEETNAKSLQIHLTLPTTTSLSYLLQNLPSGYSVVEFPELRVMARHNLPGDVVALAPEAVAGEKQEDAKEEKGEGKEEGSTVTLVTGGDLGGLLGGYDSSSAEEEEEEEVEEQKAQAEGKEGSGSLARLASLHGFTSHS